jgi:putative sterol carrier protein
MPAQTVQDLVNGMVEGFNPEKAAGMDATIQFHFTGEMGGDWILRIKDQKISCEQGTADKADLTMIADASDYLKISSGELDGTKAFMMGKLKVKGNMNIAMKLQTLIMPK